MTKKTWIDETGLVIPASRVTKSEKLKERVADSLRKKSEKASDLLAQVKADFISGVEGVFKAVMEENGGVPDNYKGNFVFYNFDRTIKVERDIQGRIEFDDAMIAIAKQHLDKFISNNSGNIDQVIVDMYMDAFSTSRGKLDTKKVMNMVRYRQRIPANKYPEFHKAIDAVEKGIRRPGSKTYYRISLLQKEGEYATIELNFSAL